jgi:hypothetical protein
MSCTLPLDMLGGLARTNTGGERPEGEVSCSSLLMVSFHQPSHEFTFGVGMNFISYPLVLTPLV